MTNLVAELREAAEKGSDYVTPDMLTRAANEIERLTAEPQQPLRFTMMAYEDDISGRYVEADPTPYGEWVRYADIEHLLLPVADGPDADARVDDCRNSQGPEPMAPAPPAEEARRSRLTFDASIPADQRDPFASVKCCPVLERDSRVAEGWCAEMEQDSEGKWVHVETAMHAIEVMRQRTSELLRQNFILAAYMVDEMEDDDPSRQEAASIDTTALFEKTRAALNRRTQP